MDTDARGQLGGYDTTEAVRKRLAGESLAFKCATCGMTNSEIIKASEERAKESSSSSDEVKIPDELNMGFKDELEANKKKQAEEDAEAAEVAEGFVQTVPNPPANHDTATSSSVPITADTTQNRQAQPGHSIPQPTRTVPLPSQVPERQAVSPSHRRSLDDGVPVWIDRLIVALVILLAVLVLKVLFGV